MRYMREYFDAESGKNLVQVNHRGSRGPIPEAIPGLLSLQASLLTGRELEQMTLKCPFQSKTYSMMTFKSWKHPWGIIFPALLIFWVSKKVLKKSFVLRKFQVLNQFELAKEKSQTKSFLEWRFPFRDDFSLMKVPSLQVLEKKMSSTTVDSGAVISFILCKDIALRLKCSENLTKA